MELLRALKIAIFERATETGSPLGQLVGTKVFDTRVPPGQDPPWVRYYVVAAGEENVFYTKPPVATRLRVAFDAVSSQSVATEAENIADAVTKEFDGAALVQDNWSFSFKRLSKRKIFDPDTQSWMVTVEYQVVAKAVS